jgi:hypothetical protein
MADENRSTEGFALGFIIAVIVYLLLRKEFEKKRCGCGGGETGAIASGSASKRTDAGCGVCPDGCNSNTAVELPVNPGTSIGAKLGGGGGWGRSGGGSGGWVQG